MPNHNRLPAGFACGPVLGFPATSGGPVDKVARAKLEAALGERCILGGNYRKALEHFTNAVKLRPEVGVYHLGVACAAWRSGIKSVVEEHFSRALTAQPNNPEIHDKVASWFMQKGDLNGALRHSEHAMRLRPADIQYKVTHADVLLTSGRTEAAGELIRPLVESGAGGPWLARVFAKIAERSGSHAEAAAFIERELQSSSVSQIDKARLHFAAAKLLDHLGRFAEAFEHARRANALDQEPWDPQANSRLVANQIAYFTQTRVRMLPRAMQPSRRVLLIVGMPRSGTTLVEQILASHPSVFGAGERTWLSEAAQAANTAEWACGQRFPDCWDHLTINQANQLAAHYLNQLNSLDQNAIYITDKMPRNFMFLGTAQMLLPECRVIHCVRDPRDTCLSCYFTDFESGNGFSRKFSYLAKYYQDYTRLMAHWKSVLELPILDVRYEELIADQSGQTHRMLDFLKVPWDDRCTAFHQNNRVVTSASRDQVRKPIYHSSAGRWKHYEQYIPEFSALTER